MVITSYNCTCVSEITKGQQLLPFTKLEEMIKDESYSFGVSCEGAWTPKFKVLKITL